MELPSVTSKILTQSLNAVGELKNEIETFLDLPHSSKSDKSSCFDISDLVPSTSPADSPFAKESSKESAIPLKKKTFNKKEQYKREDNDDAAKKHKEEKTFFGNLTRFTRRYMRKITRFLRDQFGISPKTSERVVALLIIVISVYLFSRSRFKQLMRKYRLKRMSEQSIRSLRAARLANAGVGERKKANFSFSNSSTGTSADRHDSALSDAKPKNS